MLISALFLALFYQKILEFGIFGKLVTLRELQITGTGDAKNKVEIYANLQLFVKSNSAFTVDTEFL